MALIWPLVWELLYALGVAQKDKNKKTQKQTKPKKLNNLTKKWAEDFNKRFFQRGNAHENMFNIAHQGNANQNHNEILPHTCQNDYHQKEQK